MIVQCSNEITVTIINVGQKFRGLGPHLTQSPLRWGLPPYQVASWSMQPFGRNRYGPKIGWGLCPFGEGELGPHLTQWGQGRGLYLHAKFHLDPSKRLATVYERHRQDRQDRQTNRQRSDSIGRTVLQTVAQKSKMMAGRHLEIRKIAISLQRSDRRPQNLTRWRTLTLSSPPAVKILNLVRLSDPRFWVMRAFASP